MITDNPKISVLDHGFVRLVDAMGGDIAVARAARVSFDAAWRAGENEGSDAKLIRFLWKNHHTTPFEAVTFTFEIKAPIFVFRQWHRHRTWSYNELSARYRELPAEFYVPDPAYIGVQATNNKQGRDRDLEYDGRKRVDEAALVTQHCLSAFALYKHLLEQGWNRAGTGLAARARQVRAAGQHIQPHVRDRGSSQPDEVLDTALRRACSI